MNPFAGDEGPDRIYAVTTGRAPADDERFDVVSLIVGEVDPAPGMQSEHAMVLRTCRHHPVAVVELSARLGLPISVLQLVLRDLVGLGRVTARHPTSAPAPRELADLDTLKQVLVGLQNL
ncbi:DUF742 domain-containing protein [Actinomadura xylanilytica]|uniref:DUF742 domain-containing protein n=1 Tax=Actinomadura xylanilytica TaxID=887459 RepID=UPI00255AD426|nr:DUF742 domain-containing protein [Actinomadura xylanilytica]MDL4775485.1 DUF742 domain-containing protein [Actinomadura xylanilytica]